MRLVILSSNKSSKSRYWCKLQESCAEKSGDSCSWKSFVQSVVTVIAEVCNPLTRPDCPIVAKSCFFKVLMLIDGDAMLKLKINRLTDGVNNKHKFGSASTQ